MSESARIGCEDLPRIHEGLEFSLKVNARESSSPADWHRSRCSNINVHVIMIITNEDSCRVHRITGTSTG